MRDEEERPAAKDGESMMNYGIPALSCDQLSLWFQEDDDHPHAPSCSGSIVLKDILPPAPPPGFELPRPAAVAGSKEVDGDGEGSGGKRQHASSHMQTRDEGYYVS
ncbi:hypothetical protein Salat_1814500 [Sesamum alatum]|uniref:Uncharacterized protein n=1 Tax=Sesamum alatum TaxID=300844 RepID=A0AAE1Y301_9LAMI|nr:hypothetical protein Salat_1814500 [Sesamum alatum]